MSEFETNEKNRKKSGETDATRRIAVVVTHCFVCVKEKKSTPDSGLLIRNAGILSQTFANVLNQF